MLIFYIRRRMRVNILKYLMKFFNTNFIFIDVSRNRCNLIIAKMFLTDTIITGKSLWRLAFESVVLHVYIFFYIELF